MVWTLLRPNKAIFLALIGCTTTPDPWGCTDQDCRIEALRKEWSQRPGDAVESISQLPDSLEKIEAVAMLVDHHPGTTGALCELLPHGISKERCVAVNSHPFAWNDGNRVDPRSGRAGTGPSRSNWSSADFKSSDMIGVRNSAEVCEQEVDPHACAWGWAQSHAQAGDAEKAARMCASVRSSASEPNRWRHFCFLSAAEQHVSHWERARYDDSIRLCGASGTFRAACNAGLIAYLSAQVPASDMGDERLWMDHLLRARTIHEAWEDDPMGSEIMDRFWAMSLYASVSKSSGLSGDALEFVPRVAVPHLHASLAWAVATTWEGPLKYGEIHAQVLAALSHRLDRAHSQAVVAVDELIADLWPVDRDGEAHFSAISYLGSSRRTLARDTETDVGLCVLEAAARVSPPALDLLENARTLPDERLKWTAARLLEQLKAVEPQRLPVEQ